MKVVHLPCYQDNPYQGLLFDALKSRGIEAIDGGGGGNFLRSILLRWKPDVVHFHWIHPYVLRRTALLSWCRTIQFIIELLLIRLSGRRILWTLHNLSNHEGRHPHIEQFAGRWLGRLCNKVICHSQFAADQAVKTLGISRSKIHVTPHPAYTQSYTEIIKSEVARKQIGLSLQSTVLLFIGRVSAYKGVSELITAFLSLADQNEDLELVIAGRPQSEEYGNELIQLSQNHPRIHFHLHYIADEQVSVFFSAADVVVFPFRQILTSGSVLLAMSFGRACIAPRIGAIPETLPPEQTNLTYDPQVKTGLSETINHAIQQKENLAAIGAENLRCTETWTWDQLAADCESLYQNN
ncbi:MAG: glycosyltransferase family 4 protein [Gimesia sp.]